MRNWYHRSHKPAISDEEKAAAQALISPDIFSKKEKVITEEIELDNEVILELALIAHKQDITLNQLMINILMEKVNENNGANPTGGND